MESIPVFVLNQSKAQATAAVVSAGIPFKRGEMTDAGALALADAAGNAVPLQTRVSAKYPDGSCRWVLLDFPATVEAGGRAEYALSEGAPAAPERGVAVRRDGKTVTFSNGIVTFTAAEGGESGRLSSADGKAAVDIASRVEVGKPRGKVAASRVVIDSLDVYADGPVRAAVELIGRRVYDDGMEGPFFQRVEMFAGSPCVRVEDTFIYAHFPGSHAKPEHPLVLWRVEGRASGDKRRMKVMSLMYPEETEGQVVTKDGVSFWGKEPYNLSRHTDEELVGEDTPGVALGLGKSAAVLIGLVPTDGAGKDVYPPLGLWAHTTPEAYADSGALGYFAPEVPGKFEALEEGLRQGLGFWMYFQDHDPHGSFGKGPWHGIFDWGDWQVRYTDSNSVPCEWQYHEGRYGWDCGEMDTNFMLWSAFLHTGRADFWRAAVAMSRHAMDVDILNVDYRKYKLPDFVYDPHSYGAPWKEGQDRLKTINTLGLGRRHNVQQWGNGVGDTRHSFNAGMIMYYYLTGNRRAYRSALNMADMHMQRIHGYAGGEYTLAQWCVYGAWQLTGDEKYLDEFKFRLGVIVKLRRPDGSLPPALDFDKQSDYPELGWKYGYVGGLAGDYFTNALTFYYADTKDALARDMLIKMADLIAAWPRHVGHNYQSVDIIQLLAWAYIETGEAKYLDYTKYTLSLIEAKPWKKAPTTADEWFEATYDLLWQECWQIRHIGQGFRMLPYGTRALLEAEKRQA